MDPELELWVVKTPPWCCSPLNGGVSHGNTGFAADFIFDDLEGLGEVPPEVGEVGIMNRNLKGPTLSLALGDLPVEV